MTPVDHFFEALVSAASAEAERRIWERIQAQSGAFHDRTMDTQQAADYLGISRKTLYVMCAEKQIKHIPAGSMRSKRPAYLFRQSALDTWMREKEDRSCMPSNSLSTS
jgi:excisionase family DNA binding protein